jgi:hypothetical protein
MTLSIRVSCVIVLNADMLSVTFFIVMQSVVMQSVVAPWAEHGCFRMAEQP